MEEEHASRPSGDVQRDQVGDYLLCTVCGTDTLCPPPPVQPPTQLVNIPSLSSQAHSLSNPPYTTTHSAGHSLPLSTFTSSVQLPPIQLRQSPPSRHRPTYPPPCRFETANCRYHMVHRKALGSRRTIQNHALGCRFCRAPAVK